MVFRPVACTVVLLAVSAAQTIVPSNANTSISSLPGTIQLQDQNQENITTLVPLSRAAAQGQNSPLTGDLYYATVGNAANASVDDIPYISCNDLDYPGNLDAGYVFQQTFKHKIAAVILYSTASDFCNYTDMTPSLHDFPVFSMTNKEDSQKVLNQTTSLTASAKYAVSILIPRLAQSSGDNSGQSHNNQNSNNNNNNNNNTNPLGPSPSTAVAMIILYSITGIITALFLVIIITGAIRAHRHPDRYGPRDVLGRPRQSRARGLGRAILDTLPIVKFGQNEPAKPVDVELGSTAESRDVNGANAGTREATERAGAETQQAEIQQDATADQQSGIAAALPVAAGALTPQEDSSEEGLGCSICTDDFEKGQDIRVLPCNHKFHPECVDPWLLNVSGTCPLCRVDLRPVESRTSTDAQDPNQLAPPLQPEAPMSHRRRTAFLDMLSLRSRPNASSEERISALRRLREQRRNGSGDIESGSVNGSTDDVTAARRSKRLSARFSHVFSGRSRGAGHDEPPLPAEASSSASSSTAPEASTHASSSQAPNIQATSSNPPPNPEPDQSGRT